MQHQVVLAPSPLPEVTGANNVALTGITWAEVNLDAIAHNVRAIKRYVGPTVGIIAVVKANAYGHGTVPVAQIALESGAERLAVYRLMEGIELRRAGITAPVLILGYTLPSEAQDVVRWNLTPTVNEYAQAAALAAEANRQGKYLPVHVKVDTGLGRFGLLPEQVIPFCQTLYDMSGIELEGVYTHFAVADESSASSRAYTQHQLEVYLAALEDLKTRGIVAPLHHTAHSAALLSFPRSHLDAVRPGIALYGLSPFSNGASPIALQPAMTLKSRVIRLRTLPAGACIGYGRTFVAPCPIKVALVPVGYGDGYHRIITHRGHVLIRGQRAPILGRISMDQIVVDVSVIPRVAQHDEVVLFGRQAQATLSAAEVAAWAETISYEVTTSLLPRVPRVYLRGGQIVAIHRLEEKIELKDTLYKRVGIAAGGADTLPL